MTYWYLSKSEILSKGHSFKPTFYITRHISVSCYPQNRIVRAKFKNSVFAKWGEKPLMLKIGIFLELQYVVCQIKRENKLNTKNIHIIITLLNYNNLAHTQTEILAKIHPLPHFGDL